MGIGLWLGQCDLMVVSLDDFNLMLSNAFFISAKVTVLPWLGGIFIAGGSRPTFVNGEYDEGDTKVGKKENMLLN